MPISAFEVLLRDYLLPLAVLASSASASVTLGFVYRTWQTLEEHDRALHGEESIDGHDGIVTAVNQNTRMTDHHARVLRRNDLMEYADPAPGRGPPKRPPRSSPPGGVRRTRAEDEGGEESGSASD